MVADRGKGWCYFILFVGTEAAIISFHLIIGWLSFHLSIGVKSASLNFYISKTSLTRDTLYWEIFYSILYIGHGFNLWGEKWGRGAG